MKWLCLEIYYPVWPVWDCMRCCGICWIEMGVYQVWQIENRDCQRNGRMII